MTTKNRARGRRTGDRIELVVRPERSLLVRVLLLLWRWRWEIVIALVLLGVFGHLIQHMSQRAALLAIVGPVVVVLAVPFTRRPVKARLWCLVSRHRVRACLVQMRTMNWDGRVPLLLLVRPTNVGERVWLWMRPGLSVLDLETRTEAIAAACWAREARMQRSRRFAALLCLDVVRRDPLSTGSKIGSPLLRATATVPAQPAPNPHPLAARSVVRESESPAPSGGSAPALPAARTPADGGTPATKPAPAPPRLVSLNGEDVSDYV
jgi:hypothetical protein